MKKTLFILALTAVTLLSGCAAPGVVSNVTVFENLSTAEATKTYMVEATPEQSNNLEFGSYVGLLNQQLQRHGYVSVTTDPALTVSLNYGTTATVASSLPPVPFSGLYGTRHGHYFGSGWQTAVDTVFMHQMEVSISRIADNKNLYTVRTRLMSDNPELSLSMSYLMESAFQNYPGRNGTTQTVTVPLQQ